jgi:hypothetical protein
MEGPYFVPYSFLLLSNKFCNGGGGGSGPSRAIKLLYAPAPPPPTVKALKPPSRALVHETCFVTNKTYREAYPLYHSRADLIWLDGLAWLFKNKIGIINYLENEQIFQIKKNVLVR